MSLNEFDYNYSLIIPHYNIPLYLKRLLSTIPKRKDLQIIVVDDCSNRDLDELEQVRKNFSDFEWYTSGLNGGGGKARNVGLSYAKGRYVMFADADDYFNPNFNDILDKYSETNFDIVYLNCSAVTEEYLENCKRAVFIGNTLKYLLNNKKENEVKYRLPQPWSKLISLDLIKKNNITFEESPIANDVKFSTLCDSVASNIKIDLHAIYCTVERADSTSHQVISSEKALIRLRIDCEKWYYLKKENISYIRLYECIGVPLASLFFNTPSYMSQAYEICQKYGIKKVQILKVLFEFRMKRFVKKIISFLI